MTTLARLFRSMTPRGTLAGVSKYRQKVFVTTSVVYLPLLVARTKTTTRIVSAGISCSNVPTPADGGTSLAWRELHDQSPASYGVETFNGYVELIPPKTALPYEKSEIMESALDYIRVVSFGIACRRNMLDAPVEIAEDAVLDNVRLSKKGGAKFKVTMRMGKDLIGNLTAQDTWTKSKVSIDFDGAKLFQTLKHDSPLITGSS